MTPRAPLQARLQQQALYGRLPLLPSEREYSTRGILATGFALSVAAWSFLIGGYAANVVGAVQGYVIKQLGWTGSSAPSWRSARLNLLTVDGDQKVLDGDFNGDQKLGLAWAHRLVYWL